MAGYVRLPVSADPGALQSEFFNYLMESIPGYVPRDGNLSTWMALIMCRYIAENRTLTETVSEDIFRFFGQSMLGLAPRLEASATTMTNWTMIDNKGYTIPSGTTIGIRVAGDRLIPFRTTQDNVVSVGSTTPAVGQIMVTAVEPGTEANGLPPGPAELIDSLSFVDTIVTNVASAGGVEAESDFDYISRLRDELQLLSPRPILPADFSTLARRIPAVFRALTIDGYDPGNGTYNNERMVSVAIVGEDGLALSAQVHNQVINLLEAEREVNFVIHVINPMWVTLTIAFTITVRPGYGATDTRIAAEDAVKSFIAPGTWASESNDPIAWNNDVVVRPLELASVIYGIAGVMDVTALTVNGSSNPYTMAGVAVLPHQNSTVTGTVA